MLPALLKWCSFLLVLWHSCASKVETCSTIIHRQVIGIYGHVETFFREKNVAMLSFVKQEWATEPSKMKRNSQSDASSDWGTTIITGVTNRSCNWKGHGKIRWGTGHGRHNDTPTILRECSLGSFEGSSIEKTWKNMLWTGLWGCFSVKWSPKTWILSYSALDFEDVILSECLFWRAKRCTRYILDSWLTFTNILFMKWTSKGLARISTISSKVDHYQHARINKGEPPPQSHSIVLFWTPKVLLWTAAWKSHHHT